ncbi:MAG: MmgE/PrpD family protein [Alphaproteobacteria bacterium]|nr:MAG: MmgE/PrpD family protein [Alphaproteobacteria bacterium]
MADIDTSVSASAGPCDDKGGDARNPLEAFAAWITGTRTDWPAQALHSAHREFIDFIAVMIAGLAEPATAKVRQVARGWGLGPASAVGCSTRLAAPWAALVNGTAGHVLDFDDNFDPPKAHATTVLAPAILALGEEVAADGARVLDAYIVGLQIQGRLGQALNPYHRDRGWHATATTGAFGAAAACARLLGLDAEATANALSISVSMASGFMSQFGTMTKPLHAGLAAKAGIMAARLAEAGMTAGRATLDGPHGMQRLMVGPDFVELREGHTHVDHGQTMRFETANVGEPLLITEHGYRVKRFPNCGSAHRAMDALLFLMAEHDFTPADIEKIEVHAPAVHLNNLMYRNPKTGLEAKFSMEYALASLLIRGRAGIAEFTDEAVADEMVRAAMKLVERHPVPGLEGEIVTRVIVRLKDGRTLEEAREWPEGSKWKPFPDDLYWKKFDECTQTLLPGEIRRLVREALAGLPELAHIGTLMSPLAREFGG